jgi:hypothetical protein
LATVTIKGRSFEVPDDKAEEFVGPFEERKNCGLVDGEPVVYRLDDRFVLSKEWDKTYGPAFLIARVNLGKNKQPIWIPSESMVGVNSLSELIPLRGQTSDTPQGFYKTLSEIKWPRKYP